MKLYAPSYLYQYNYYKEKRDWNNAIRCLKKGIGQNNSIKYLQKDFIICYKKKYGKRSNFADALENFKRSCRCKSIEEAINAFEQNINFEKDNFVFQKDWGLGRIKEVAGNYITIYFFDMETGKITYSKDFDLASAGRTFSILKENHIWIIMLANSIADLKNMVMDKDEEKNKEKVKNILRIIINSFNNCSDLNQIKKEIARIIKDTTEWESWIRVAKDILDNDPAFKEIPGKEGFYKVRLKSITKEEEEKLFSKFRNSYNFFDKYSIFKKYSRRDFKNNEFYDEMLGYFLDIYNNSNNVEEKVGSWFLLKNTDKKTVESFADLYSQIPDIVATFNAIPVWQSRLRIEFLKQIKNNNSLWPDIFCKLFPYCLEPAILNSLYADRLKNESNLLEMFKFLLDKYETYKWPFVWLCENKDKFSSVFGFCFIMPNDEKILNNMSELLDFTNRQIELDGGKDVLNVLFSKYIEQYLSDPYYPFKKGKISRLEHYINTVDENKAKQMLNKFNHTEGLSAKVKSRINEAFVNRFHNGPKKAGKDLPAGPDTGEFWATKTGLCKKQKDLDNMQDLIAKKEQELKEITGQSEKKIKKQDLEYLKHNFNILCQQAGNLLENISKAQVFKRANLDLGRISFGTKVTLLNLDTNENIGYTILGPFESELELEKNIISYLSPLANKLRGAEKYDELHFEVNSTQYNLKVLSIEASELV
jgi:transcription elongation GreA/GreB family factor